MDVYLTLYTNINLEWTTCLNVRVKTIKTLEKNTGVSLCDLGVANDFLDKTSKAQTTKRENIYIKQGFIKIEKGQHQKKVKDS